MNWNDLYKGIDVFDEYTYYVDEKLTIPYTGHVEDYFQGKLSWEFDVVKGVREGIEKMYYDDTGELEQINEVRNNRGYGLGIEYYKSGKIRSIFTQLHELTVDWYSYDEDCNLKEIHILDRDNAFGIAYSTIEDKLPALREKCNLAKLNEEILKYGKPLNGIGSDDFENRYFDALYKASKAAFEKLFSTKEHFYYCTLTITGDGLTPVISAWSKEALQEEADGDEEYKKDIEWSYADSPYYAWEYDSFGDVTALLDKRLKMSEASEKEWVKEINMRLDVMEKVLRKLDEEGLFSLTQERGDIVVCAEIMPPDESNTERVSRLNKEDSPMFCRWLEEIAEC